MDTDAADPSAITAADQSSSDIVDLAHETRRTESESPEIKNENNQPNDSVEPTPVNELDVGNEVNEDEASTSNDENREDVDKNSSTNSIIWLESTINMPAEKPDDMEEEANRQNETESEPCAPLNDEQDKASHRQETDTMNQEAMDIDEDERAVGGTESPDPEGSEQEQTVHQMETGAVQNGVRAKCCNSECCHTSNEIWVAPMYALSCYDVRKKKKTLYICQLCLDRAVAHYEMLRGMLAAQRPLRSAEPFRQTDLVEILDSSDDEDESQEASEAKETPLPPEVVALVEAELQTIVEDGFKKYHVVQHLEESTTQLRELQTRLERECEELDSSLRTLTANLVEMQETLYSCVSGSEEQVSPINIVDDCTIPSAPDDQSTNDEKPAEVERKPVEVNQVYFGMRRSLLGSWTECMVKEEIRDENNAAKYMVQFLTEENMRFMLGRKHLAYSAPSSMRLHQGLRVIAKVEASELEETGDAYLRESGNSFYAGVIAETLSKYNKFRYLVIFDNGYTHYAQPWNVRVVCEQSVAVWEDVDPHTQEFVRDYMFSYKSMRPMVQVKTGQRLTAEKNGRWRRSIVLKTDSSLVLLWFQDINHTEWIFRGSKRLEPLYQARNRKRDRQQISKFQKRNIPSIEYITIDDDDEEVNNSVNDQGTVHKRAPAALSVQVEQPVASTSTAVSLLPPDTKTPLAPLASTSRATPAKRGNANVTAAPPTQIQMNKNIIYCFDDQAQGKTNNYTTKRYAGPVPFVPHDCSPGCIFPLSFDLKNYNLLARPLISGWERQICQARGKKAVSVVYRGPCGRRLRYMFEVHKYLRITKAPLNVENFDFDADIRALAMFKAERLKFELKDLSYGKELMPVSCVNYYDDTVPPPCDYSTTRVPTEGVNLLLDDEFLCGCDCEDDCFDKSRCQCWQLTIQGAKHTKPDAPIDELGYVFKRLDEPVLTGIYECNSRCKCKVNECLNRVVQHPLQTKLQVFRTCNRGWGIRSLNDIPKGSFICIYTGHLLTEETSNLICELNEDKTGDEYFADLDYIETVEEVKDGYESEVNEPSGNDSADTSDGSDTEPMGGKFKASPVSDDDFTPTRRPSTRLSITKAKLREKRLKNSARQSNTSKPGQDRERVNLIPKSLMSTADPPGPSKQRRSFRLLFGKNEHPYVIDAKKTGNLGRYFNHSCVPNLFVQNVFVDSHDLRFPWVAFFASRNIKAGTELTWNYSYDVGSVPGKVLYCHCGESECRKRLL